MSAPSTGMKAAEQPAAESLLTAFKSLSAAERRRHASVLNYWLSVRGDKEFPPLHDLDPLELSDAGPSSILMELISGGHDAEIRHLGEALREEAWPERIIDAPNPSILACIAKKLPIVAISRDFLAFEDEYETEAGQTKVSVTLLPLSAGGAWVDYVYALVSTETPGATTAKPAKKAKEPEPEPKAGHEDQIQAKDIEQPVAEQLVDEEPAREESSEKAQSVEQSISQSVEEEAPEATDPDIAEPQPVAPDAVTSVEPFEPESAIEPEDEFEPAPEPDPLPSAVAKAAPGFSKLLDSIAGLTGFYGSQPVKVEPVVEPQPEPGPLPVDDAVAEEPAADHIEHGQAVVEEPIAEDVSIDDRHTDEALAKLPEEQPIDEAASLATEQFVPSAPEGSLQNKLTEVRAKADEARMARLKANATLCEGLGAAYDFALDAEEAPEEYLRLVEAQGLKIQLRSPMKPVVKLAFAGMCDDATIKQLEAVLAWAFDEELPRGSLAERIESEGGIAAVLVQAKAA